MSEVEYVPVDAVYGLSANDTYIFAARGSGLYRSADHGASWQNMTSSIADHIATTVVITANRTVIAGTNGAVLWSDDEGENWRLTGLASPPPLITSLAISPNYIEDGTVFAGTAEDGVFVSTDRGQQWVPWNFGLIDLDVDCLAISPNFLSDQMILTGTQTGIFQSQDGGKSWHETLFPMNTAPVLSLAFASNQIIAGTESHGLLVSENAGKEWRTLTELAEVNSKTIHMIQTNGEYMTILTDDALLRLNVTDASYEVLHRFAPQQALSLASSQQHWLVGFMDGQITII